MSQGFKTNSNDVFSKGVTSSYLAGPTVAESRSSRPATKEQQLRLLNPTYMSTNTMHLRNNDTLEKIRTGL